MRALVVAAILAISAGTSAAQPACGPRAAIIEKLVQKYSEGPVGIGVQNAGALFEIWRNRETGSWTILRTSPRGMSCVMAAGTAWRDLAAEDSEDL